MNQTVVYFTILAICLALIAAGAVGAHLIWQGKYRRALDAYTAVCRAQFQAQREEWETARKNSYTQQEAMRAEQGRMFLLMKDEQDQIALFLREHYAKEIAQGFHSGRGLGAIVCGYLAREREQQQRRFDAASQQRTTDAIAATARIKEGAITNA